MSKPTAAWLWALPIGWTFVVALSLWWNTEHIQRTVWDLAEVAARSSFEKDILYRQWASMHGGVYVPATAETPPNPHLSHLRERDITTPSGRPLTLVNPAYMTRQVHELAKEKYRHLGHITSLTPIRPGNEPDDWERRALDAFERGAAEAKSVEPIDGEPHLRFMRPMRVTDGCLKCHAAQGYREGDIRGGISVAVPMKDYTAIVQPHQRGELLAHGVIWGAGLVPLGVGIWQLQRRRREHERGEARLRESEARLNKAQEIAHVGSWELDLASDRLSWSDEVYRIFGLPPQSVEASYRTFLDLVHPDDRAAVDAAYSGSLREGRDVYEVEHRVVRTSTGEVRHVRERCHHFRDQTGRVVRSVGMVHDITESKRAEEALRDRNRYFETILENAPIGFAVNRIHDGQIVFVGSKFEEIYGVPRDSLHSVEEFFEKVYPDPDVREQIRARVMADVATGDPARMRWEDLPVTTASGEHRFITATNIPLVDQDLMVSTVQDVTARRRAEDERGKLQVQLAQAQKMESVGRLAGGVAHDFNNMLTVILGHTGMALAQVDASEPLHADLVAIEKAAERSADLTRQLLAFARKQTVAPRVLDLNDKVAGMLKMLRRLIGEDIDLAWMPGLDLGLVKIDPSQVDQLLANLCVNARDAIAGAGKVTIETENIHFDEAHCAVHPGVSPGAYVLLAVSDDGCGMEKDVVEHLFEPFFTTKGVGHGTGLGLATVYGIVKQNEGFISVYSEPGKGTTFKVYLKRCEGEAAQAVPESTAALPTASGETVLLVEDEEAILRLAEAALGQLGYRVLAASTPGEAIRQAQECAGEIHLLITDVVMPEMNGRELAVRVAATRPGVKCLFMSGYTADVIAHRGVLDEGVQFLQKPFSVRDLAAKIRETLEQK